MEELAVEEAPEAEVAVAPEAPEAEEAAEVEASAAEVAPEAEEAPEVPPPVAPPPPREPSHARATDNAARATPTATIKILAPVIAASTEHVSTKCFPIVALPISSATIIKCAPTIAAI